MQVFINESSIHEQYGNVYEFLDSVKNFVNSIILISELKDEKQFLKSDLFFYSKGLKGTHFEKSLKANHSINSFFNENFNRINPKSWERSLTHTDEDEYIYEKENYVRTSIAELSERKILESSLKGFLLNFTPSLFSDKTQIEIIKNNSETVKVDCTYDPISIYNWLVDNGYIVPSEIYDTNSKFPPIDKQTILKDTALFEITNYPPNKGRKVYRKKGTNQLWSVDSLHYGEGAHIEIFNENDRKHIGISLYKEDKIDTTKAEVGRKIFLE